MASVCICIWSFHFLSITVIHMHFILLCSLFLLYFSVSSFFTLLPFPTISAAYPFTFLPFLFFLSSFLYCYIFSHSVFFYNSSFSSTSFIPFLLWLCHFFSIHVLHISSGNTISLLSKCKYHIKTLLLVIELMWKYRLPIIYDKVILCLSHYNELPI